MCGERGKPWGGSSEQGRAGTAAPKGYKLRATDTSKKSTDPPRVKAWKKGPTRNRIVRHTAGPFLSSAHCLKKNKSVLFVSRHARSESRSSKCAKSDQTSSNHMLNRTSRRIQGICHGTQRFSHSKHDKTYTFIFRKAARVLVTPQTKCACRFSNLNNSVDHVFWLSA